MLYMVIERFKNRDAKAVYRRFREKGRMAPDGLAYVESWVETNFDRCFQLMECGDARLLEVWANQWRDLAERSGRDHHAATLSYTFCRKLCAPRSLFNKAASLGRSCSLSAVNFTPIPAPDSACRTTASARI